MLMKGGNLCIRNFEEKDTDAFYHYRKEPIVAQFQGFDVFNYEQARQFVQDHKNNIPGSGTAWQQYAISLNSNDILVGDCALKMNNEQEKTAEIGCTISPENQRKGYAKEALLLLIGLLFEKHPVRRIVAITDVENPGSIALLESIGFRKEAHFVENIWFNNKWGSEYGYALLKKEWIDKNSPS